MRKALSLPYLSTRAAPLLHQVSDGLRQVSADPVLAIEFLKLCMRGMRQYAIHAALIGANQRSQGPQRDVTAIQSGYFHFVWMVTRAGQYMPVDKGAIEEYAHLRSVWIVHERHSAVIRRLCLGRNCCCASILPRRRSQHSTEESVHMALIVKPA